MRPSRKKLLVDKPVQIGLVSRLTFHWFILLAATVVILPLFRAVLRGDYAVPLSDRFDEAAGDATIMFLLFLMLLPYFVYDTFKETNRFAGPMYRLRQAIHAIAEGEPHTPISFRDDDYWREVAEDFNSMVEQMGIPTQQLENQRPTDDSDHVDQDSTVAV